MMKLIKKYWYLFLLLLIIDSLVILSATLKSNYEITTPGGLNEVADLIEIDTKTDYSGSFNTIFVQSFDKGTYLQKFLASFSDSIEIEEIIPEEDYFDNTLFENYQAGVIQKTQSIEASIICAYRYLAAINPEVNIDFTFNGFIVYANMKEQKALKINDLIIGCQKEDGIKIDITNPTELSKALNNLKIGDKVYYLRDGKEMNYTVDKVLSKDNLNNFYAYAKYAINQETIYPKYKLHHGNTLGPSGGLLQTLSVYCQVSGIDLTKGRKIAGTGTISASGTVGKIGGVRQKIITAIRNDVDLFICPKAHEQEAMEAYLSQKNHEKMAIYFVETFEEALEVLK